MNLKCLRRVFGPGMVVGLALGFLTVAQAAAQTVEKVADLNFVSSDGVGIGGYEPLARFTYPSGHQPMVYHRQGRDV